MKEFLLTENHIKLLSRMIVEWQDAEFGAPAIDPKRPYGNSSVILDIAEILGETDALCPHCGEPIANTDNTKYYDLHRETEMALQVVLSAKSFKPGRYISDDYSSDWKLSK